MKKNLPPLHLAAAILAAMGGAGILWKGYSSGNGELTGIVLVQLSNLCFAAGQIAYISLKNSLVREKRSILLRLCLCRLPAGYFAFRPAVRTGLLAGDFNRAMVAAGLFGRHRFRSLFFLWNYGARRVTPVKLAIMNNLKIPLAAMTSCYCSGAFQHVPSVHRLPAYPGLFPDRPYFLKKRRIK